METDPATDGAVVLCIDGPFDNRKVRVNSIPADAHPDRFGRTGCVYHFPDAPDWEYRLERHAGAWMLMAAPRKQESMAG